MEANQLSWKRRPTSTEVKLPPTSIEVNLLQFTSMEVAMDVASFSTFIYVHEGFYLLTYLSANFHGISK